MGMPKVSMAFDTESISSVITLVGEHLMQILADDDERAQQKERSAERLKKNDSAEGKVNYADQAVLANLDWGIEAMEEAIRTSHSAAKIARLEYAEKLLQVCASLDCRSPSLVTAGVPNSYLSAWARFNLALVWRLRNNELKAAREILEMFFVEPYFSRVNFAPGIWESIFLPHVTSIVQWYTQQSRSLPDSPHPASVVDADHETSASTDESSRLLELEKVYQDSLDENTKQYARFYLECLTHDSAGRRGMPLMPIAETPMTPVETERRPRALRLPPPLIIDSPRGTGNAGVFDDSSDRLAGGAQDIEDRRFRSENIVATVNDSASGAEAETVGRSGGVQAERLITRSTSRRRKLQIENAALRALQATGEYQQKSTKVSATKSDLEGTDSPSAQVNRVSQSSSSGDYGYLRSQSFREDVSYSDSPRIFTAKAPTPSAVDNSSDLDESDHELELTEAQRREVATVVRTRPMERCDSRASSIFSVGGDESVADAMYLEDDEDDNWPSSNTGTFDNYPDSPVQISSSYARTNVVQTQESKSGSSNTPPLVVRAPKDFVCPITSQLFNDPVTLETGQTYERKAIQEWLDCGNTTCPITRQTLRFKRLPKTNYVMKRLVEIWKEQLPEKTQEFTYGQSLSTVFQFDLGPTSPEKLRDSDSSSEGSERSLEHSSPRSVSSTSSADSAGSRKSPSSHHETIMSPANQNTQENLSYSPREGSLSVRNQNRQEKLDSPSRNTRLSITNQNRPENLDILLEDLQSALTFLCSSEDLNECESSVLLIARMWRDSKADPEIATLLSRDEVMSTLIEVLINSVSTKVLTASLYLVSGTLAALDRSRSMILRADPDVRCFMELLRKGLSTTSVVLYQLKLPTNQLISLDLMTFLVSILKQSSESRKAVESEYPLPMRPKTAAVLILNQIVTCSDHTTLQRNCKAMIDLAAIPALTTSLDSDCVDERAGAVSLLLGCMQSDGRCRNMIVRSARLAKVVQLLHSGDTQSVTRTIAFLAELVRITRRNQINDIMNVLQSEGLLSSMHVLLIQLQMAPLQQRPIAAGLLLQLDLMTEPVKRSMFRDEVVETFVEALTKGNTSAQTEAANTIVNLGGRFSSSGKSLTEACLLKAAGLEKSFVTLIKEDTFLNETFDTSKMEEEEELAKDWEKRVAGALIDDEGSVVPAVAKGLESRLQEVFKPCLIAATWLTCLSPSLHDSGARNKVRIYLLRPFMKVLETAKDTKVKVLATLALHTMVSDPEAAKELADSGSHLGDTLRQLKKSTWAAQDLLGMFFHYPSTISGDLCSYCEEGELDVSENGEVRSFAKSRNQIFSGHSDGTLKVWNTQKKFPVLIQEAREHTRSVTCLATSSTMDRLYSGSLDRTIRVWALGQDKIKCLRIFELRDSVQGLAVNGPMACIIPQGPGFQVQCEESATKSLNTNKHVQSLTISEGKVICGCTDNSIQEFDPIEGSMVTIQNGVKTLLGKKPIYAVQVYKSFLYAAGSPVDGVACKVWSRSSLSLVGHVVTDAEVRSMALNASFIFLGSRSGSIEVWKQGKFYKVTTIGVGSKVNCLLVDEDVVYSGAEDGKVRVWKKTEHFIEKDHYGKLLVTGGASAVVIIGEQSDKN